MATPDTYNGWTNRETWLAKLWIDNDESLYREWTERANEIYDDTATRAGAVAGLAEELKDYFENIALPEAMTGASLYTDLLQTALARVSWYEIAAAMHDDIHEDRIRTGAETSDRDASETASYAGPLDESRDNLPTDPNKAPTMEQLRRDRDELTKRTDDGEKE